jgi:tRNA 2-(methylsulfanyl)-N6-isopentenyladenosine37 hydroxylase
MLELRCETRAGWVEVVMAAFDDFLRDHAACERKANASALRLVAHYPDRLLLVREMIDLAIEELQHFRLVHEKLVERGLHLDRDTPDPYVNGLRVHIRTAREVQLLDTLLVSSLIEARSCERFRILAASLPEAAPWGQYRKLYGGLVAAEARHHGLFVRLAREYHPEPVVRARLEELLDHEARLMDALPLRPAVH